MQTESHTRQAKAGGEYGANGEWYPGGAFINTVPENPKGKAKSRRPVGKSEIEPYVWALPPSEGAISIFRCICGIEIPVSRVAPMVFAFNPELRGVFTQGNAIECRKADVAAYNSGMRWKFADGSYAK